MDAAVPGIDGIAATSRLLPSRSRFPGPVPDILGGGRHDPSGVRRRCRRLPVEVGHEFGLPYEHVCDLSQDLPEIVLN
ncbi:MAG TPA: hypothetical protein VGP27_20755 [Mycobacterium sp.]|nr:hypothetical protein [Mycobacterium sp.]